MQAVPPGLGSAVENSFLLLGPISPLSRRRRARVLTDQEIIQVAAASFTGQISVVRRRNQRDRFSSSSVSV